MTDEPGAAAIRPATGADRAGVLNVARATGLFAEAELAEVAATFDGFLSGASPEDRWLVHVDATAVSAVAYYAPERMTDGTWNLFLLAVHPDRHGQGRGAALVREVEHELRLAGARVLLIETSGVPDFGRQRSFYAGLGFVEEARIREFYAADDDKVVFWKNLSTAPVPAGAAFSADTPTKPRTATVADHANLLALAEAFYAEDGFTASADDLARHLHTLLLSDLAHVAIAEEKGPPFAFAITSTTFGLEYGLIAELEDLYVAPAHRRQGWAERLIEDAVAWARLRGVTHMEVVTAPQGSDVTHLNIYYEERGFRNEGRQIRTRNLSSGTADDAHPDV